LNTDKRKFESSQKDESRAQSVDSSKAYRKSSRAFDCLLLLVTSFIVTCFGRFSVLVMHFRRWIFASSHLPFQ